MALKASRSKDVQQWRDAATAALDAADLPGLALSFKYCGDDAVSLTMACKNDPYHWSKVLPKTCKNRFCSECESYAQAKRLEVYVPVIDDALAHGPKSYRLRHIVLTTPVKLTDDDAHEKLLKYWVYVNKALNRVAWRELDKTNKLTRSEKRRGRIDWKTHDMGSLIGAEFGEDGHKLHFHILFWGCWIAGDWLTEEYRHYTKDESRVVKIKGVKDAGKGAKEVLAKYATKLTELPPKLVPTLHNVLKGTRRVRGYGIFFAVPREELPRCSCEVCGAGVYTVSTDIYEQAKREVLTARSAKPLLNLISGNKSGEKSNSPPTAVQLELPDIPPERSQRAKNFDAMGW